MKAILTYIFVCISLFVAGAGLAWALGLPTATTAATDAAKPPAPIPAIQDVVPSNPQAAVVKAEGDAPAELPVPVRGESLSAEELFRFGAMYREQQQSITQRDKALRRREARLKLVHNDVEGSRKELDGMRSQVRDMMTRAESVMSQLQAESAKLQEEKLKHKSVEEAQATPTAVDASESENIRKISSWFQSMPVDKAAEYLKQLSNDGKVDSAVKLLANIEERNTAKILSEMDDPALVVEIMEAFRELKQPRNNVARRPN